MIIWSIDIGEKRLGISILEKDIYDPKSKPRILFMENIHLYQKKVPTVAQLQERYNIHGLNDFLSDKEVHEIVTKALTEWEALEAKRATQLQDCRKQRESLKGKIKRLKSRAEKCTSREEIAAITAKQIALEEELVTLARRDDGGTRVKSPSLPTSPFRMDVDEDAADGDEPELCDGRDSGMRKAHYVLSALFSKSDADKYLKEHRDRLEYVIDEETGKKRTGLGETSNHFAVPPNIDDKINMIFKVLPVYGEFWEASFGTLMPNDVIGLELQAANFGTANLSAEGIIGALLKAAPWRSTPSNPANTAQVRIVPSGRKLNNFPCDARTLSGLSAANQLTSRCFYSCVPAKNILFMHMSMGPELKYTLLKDFYDPAEIAAWRAKKEARKQKKLQEASSSTSSKKGSPSKKRSSDQMIKVIEISDDEDGDGEGQPPPLKKQPGKPKASSAVFAKARGGGGNARWAYAQAQKQRKEDGVQTAANKRIENKKEGVELVNKIFNTPEFCSQFGDGSLRWMYRTKFCWTEEVKRDPCDAFLQGLCELAEAVAKADMEIE